MGRQSRKRRAKWRAVRGHIALGNIHDRETAAASCELDAAEDRRWFHEHPGQRERQRPATLLETAAFDLPQGTMVVVELRADGSQARIFLP